MCGYLPAVGSKTCLVILSFFSVNVFSVEEEDEEEPAVAAPAVQPAASARNRRQPLAAQQPKAGKSVDRRQALEEFKKKKQQKKLAEAKSKKPPFRVGTYKLETSIRPGTVSNFIYSNVLRVLFNCSRFFSGF